MLRTASGIPGGTATYRYYADGTRRQTNHAGDTTRYCYMGGLGYLDAGDTAFAADPGDCGLLGRSVRWLPDSPSGLGA